MPKINRFRGHKTWLKRVPYVSVTGLIKGQRKPLLRQDLTGRLFWTLVSESDDRSVWNTVSRPPSVASLLAVQYTSVPDTPVTCDASTRRVRSRGLGTIRLRWGGATEVAQRLPSSEWVKHGRWHRFKHMILEAHLALGMTTLAEAVELPDVDRRISTAAAHSRRQILLEADSNPNANPNPSRNPIHNPGGSPSGTAMTRRRQSPGSGPGRWCRPRAPCP